ncbi:aspartyl/asparaginyl beta-hydroxylase domain-containing protein [Xenococcus sp. PCC 7305]|uniref:aspartyl/asparaginyl beta-hydroxylase domain-containing protein n=1 Tax=Xenococcus sp. PCC 7305 TaxID=102125 RepID=UPI0011818772|nr:aspartyl/asparaginyl beta-hydroxylase domain-containing protein [Xenococcus sp. PCC 7305]
MTQLASHNINFDDRKKLTLSFDIAKMQEEIKALALGDFVYYNVLPLRSPAHLVDPSLPLPPPADDYADGSWTEWLDSPELRNSPYLSSVVDTFRKHSKVTLVRLLRLAPRATVKEHTDPTLGLQVPKSVIRLTIPILTNDGVEFFLNENLVPMKPGECWYLRLSDPHRIINGGNTERINMTIDIVPNEWVRSLIQGK